MGLLIFSCIACKKIYNPKPRGYYRITFPEKKYQKFTSNCNFSFEFPVYGEVLPVKESYAEPCWYNVTFKDYNACFYLTYKPLQNNLPTHIEDIRTIVYKHSIKADDIIRTGAPSFDSALQGMAAGVQVNTTSGVPGAPVSVLISGLGSISLSRNPLWVIDGIPVINGATGPSYDGETAQNIFSMINPSDIENIEVLKDAAATSIYGSRGSNGVIIVTTKSGKKGEAKVSVDIKSGVSQWAKQNIG